ncbi:MAG: methionine--tRNA ligase [Planctomycetota bacterium]
MKRRFLVTGALPYANNRPHIGHVAGVYLPADVYVRYLRMRGDDVLFVCGSDDHGVPVTISAQKEGLSPPAIVERYNRAQRSAFASLGIEFDIYSGTSTCPHHVAASQDFFRRIHEAGDIVPRETEQFYCLTCNRYLPDRYVEGTCPRCRTAGARGDQCDHCGESYEQTLLIDPYCATCKSVPEIRRTTHWFLRLDRYQERLVEYLSGRKGWRETVRNFALGLVKQGLPERSITRDLDWGVPVPLPEAEGKVLYVWFDAPIGYLSFTQELFAARGEPEGWRRYWEDPTSRIVHFIGKDNTIFHAVIWPAMLIGHGGLDLPFDVPANEHLHLGGAKISKSTGNAVWAEDLVAEYGSDRVRYYLTAIAPEGRDTTFTYEDFIQRNNEVLSDVLGNLCHRVFTFAERYFDSRVPTGVAGDATAAGLYAHIAQARDRWLELIEAIRLRDAQWAVIDLAREGNRYFDAAQPWKTRKEDLTRCAVDIGACLELVHALAVLLHPFMPEVAAKLLGSFGREGQPTDALLGALGTPTLAPGSAIFPPGVLFPRLEVAPE